MAKSLLDEVLARVEGMSPEAREELSKQVASEPERNMVPNKGPQADAYFSLADILLFGGAAGGGKTYLTIGLAAQEHQRSIIFRRESSQTDGLIATGKEIIGDAARFNGQDLEWNWPDGRALKLAGLKEKDDWMKHAGRERDLICVAAGTMVLMADGSQSPIERIRVGDAVATMEGLKRVIRVHPARSKPTVRFTALDDFGRVVATQIQSTTHPVLTTAGWLSAGDLVDARRPTSAHEVGSTSRWFSPTCGVLSQLVRRSSLGLLRKAESFREWTRSLPSSVWRVGASRSDEGSADAMCYATCRGACRPALSSAHEAPPSRSRRSGPPSGGQRDPGRVSWSERASSILQDWIRHCWSCTHRCGEQPRQHPSPGLERDGGPRCLLLSTDAGQPNPMRSQANDLERTQTHSHSRRTYVHPYTQEIRRVDESCSLRDAAFEFSDAGCRDVYDLQIDEVNHYITAGGIVNQNCYDEAGELLHEQVASLIAWNRGPEGQRCRIVLASNPPRTAEGLWMIEWFAPWLDKKYPTPAAPGELRWAVFLAGKPHWREGPEDVMNVDGEPQRPLSLTFIPAALADNPARNTPEYRARLQSLPEPLRSQLLYGDFSIGLKDNANQCIPTGWIHAAQARWTEEPPEGVPMCSMGVDASGGGDDPLVIAPRYDGWYAPLIEVEGKKIPQERIGPYCAGLVVSYRRDSAHVVIDMGGGYGGSTYDHLKQNNVGIHAYKGAEATTKRTADGQLKFVNKRSAAHWLFREALDPGQPGGSPIALPPDQQLMGDLTAPTFEVTPNGIKLEPKDKVMARIGRSPDRGDAVVMAWFEGPRKITHALEWLEQGQSLGLSGRTVRRPQVINNGRQPLSVRSRR